MAIYLGNNLISYEGGNDGFMINGRLIKTASYSFNLGETNYSSITPTTTAQSLTLPTTPYSSSASTSVQVIRFGEAYGGPSINPYEHSYVGIVYAKIDYNYGSNNVAGTLHPIRFATGRDYHCGPYSQSINTTTGELNNTVTYTNSYIGSSSPILYQKADNTYAIVASQSGIYPGVSPGINSASGVYYFYLSATIGVKVSTSYAPEEALLAVNPNNTIITYYAELYEGDKSANAYYTDKVYRLAANPLT